MTSSTVGRPRSAGRLDLPDNLIPRHRRSGGRDVVYWYWRDPRDGQEKPLKCPDDRATAIRRARELNALISRQLADDIVTGIIQAPERRAAGTPFSAHAIHCLTLAEARGLAVNTMKSRKSLTNAAAAWFRDTPLHQIGVPEVAALLRHYTDQGKDRLAQALRAVLIDIWNEAKRDGLLPAEHPNVAEITRRPAAKVNRARLTLDEFRAILQQAEALADSRGPWIANSLLLALVTGQRREDLALARFRRGKDWDAAWQAFQRGDKTAVPYPYIEDGHFWVIQQKTGAMVRIPLSLRLEAIGLSVGDIIDRCRDNVASRWLIHHSVPTGNAPRGTAVWKDTISRGFADARNRAGLEWPSKTPPTYHELRSLSERLYKAQGIDTQALLGHRHARMTEIYNDPRQAEWTTVSA